jgi:YfiH family protein
MVKNCSVKAQEKQGYFELPLHPGIFAGISFLSQGDMKFDYSHENICRSIFLGSLGLDHQKSAASMQIHSKKVISITSSLDYKKNGREADGFVTKDSKAILTVTAADCMPGFLYDTETGAYGLVHSGWKGSGIIIEALELMNKLYGTQYENVRVGLGPSIGSCCYNVDKERADYFIDTFGSESAFQQNGVWFVDLKTANIKLLEKAGVGNITVIDDCTNCTEFLGSFRRQGPDKYTRMMAFITGTRPLYA